MLTAFPHASRIVVCFIIAMILWGILINLPDAVRCTGRVAADVLLGPSS